MTGSHQKNPVSPGRATALAGDLGLYVETAIEIVRLADLIVHGNATAVDLRAYADLVPTFEAAKLSVAGWTMVRQDTMARAMLERAFRAIALHRPGDRPGPDLPEPLVVSRWRTQPDIAQWFGLGANPLSCGPGEGAKRPFRKLFAGPPETGKTTCARALADAAGLPVAELRAMSLSPDEAQSVFERASRNGALLLMEHADLLLPSRVNLQPTDSDSLYYSSLSSDIMSLLDRFAGPLIATTNFPDRIDPGGRWRLGSVVSFGPMQTGLKVVP